MIDHYLLSLCSRLVAWLGHRLTTSCTCSGFTYMGRARITDPGGGRLAVRKRTGHVVAIRTNSLQRGSENCAVNNIWLNMKYL